MYANRMKIVADENIPCVREAFSTLGEVITVQGRSLSAAEVRDADVLLVRSVTRVGAGLLAGSRVRFVASATIGFDHIDLDYLAGHDIGFARAPGSNATSAAEYVLSCILVLLGDRLRDPGGISVGIIGCGNVGSRVRHRLELLGMTCRVNDPPLQAQGGHDDFVSLQEVLSADIVTVHVPLVSGGTFPTRHLINDAFIDRLAHGAVLINTSRGAVCDCGALERRLQDRHDLRVALDVWEGEPAIRTGLLEQVALGTPHIAGYSLDGKVRGTEMIYQAVCRHFGRTETWAAGSCLPAPVTMDVLAANREPQEVVIEAVLGCYDVRRDDAALRRILDMPGAERASCFDELRKSYPVRREFDQVLINLEGEGGPAGELLAGLGFQVRASTARPIAAHGAGSIPS